MTDLKDVPLQILLMATVARLGKTPPASTPILTTGIEAGHVIGSVETIGGPLTVLKGWLKGRPMALFAVDPRDAKRIESGSPVTIWHGGAILDVDYGVVTPQAAAAS